MAAPAVVNDGNFTTAQQNGAVSLAFPFAASRGDFLTFVATRNMRIESGNFAMPVAMGQRNFGNLGVGYLVNVTDPVAVEGTSLLDYQEIYANVPPPQKVPGSATATIQQIINLALDGDPPRYYAINISDTFDAFYYYDYYLENNPLPALYRSKLQQYPYGISNYLQFGLGITTPPADGLYLAANSTSQRWMGGIFCRESVFVKPPPVTKWAGLTAP